MKSFSLTRKAVLAHVASFVAKMQSVADCYAVYESLRQICADIGVKVDWDNERQHSSWFDCSITTEYCYLSLRGQPLGYLTLTEEYTRTSFGFDVEIKVSFKETTPAEYRRDRRVRRERNRARQEAYDASREVVADALRRGLPVRFNPSNSYGRGGVFKIGDHKVAAVRMLTNVFGLSEAEARRRLSSESEYINAIEIQRYSWLAETVYYFSMPAVTDDCQVGRSGSIEWEMTA